VALDLSFHWLKPEFLIIILDNFISEPLIKGKAQYS
jgi:hypothetical protein